MSRYICKESYNVHYAPRINSGSIYEATIADDVTHDGVNWRIKISDKSTIILQEKKFKQHFVSVSEERNRKISLIS